MRFTRLDEGFVFRNVPGGKRGLFYHHLVSSEAPDFVREPAETRAAIEGIKAELGASGIKDMGRVMAELKARHSTVLDMGKASGWVKESLA